MFCHFWGDATKSFSGVLMSQNRGFSFLKKGFCRFWGMHSTFLAKNRPKMQKYLCGCPFFGHSYFQLKCFAVFGTSNKMSFSDIFCTVKIMTRIMLTKICKKSRRRIRRNVIILLSFCYHLADL